MTELLKVYQQRLEQAQKEAEGYLIALAGTRACPRWQQKLDRIERALQRLHNGSFGYCVACHEAISQTRLEALVYAEYCLSCQHDYEQQTISP